MKTATKFRSALKNAARTYWFPCGIGLVLLLAYSAPSVGASMDRCGFIKIAVIAIFLTTGFISSPKSISRNVGNWRCHALVQGFSFVLIPAAILLSSGWLPDGPLKYGVYLVAVLPTTISSCVAFTIAAGGSASCAILNAVGGNLIGVFISPVLFGLLTGQFMSQGIGGIGWKIINLCLLVLLPFVVAPAIEEILKPMGVIFLLETRPHYLRSAFHVVVLCVVGALVFATLENLLFRRFREIKCGKGTHLHIEQEREEIEELIKIIQKARAKQALTKEKK